MNSVNGTRMCIDVAVNGDLFVECEETFKVNITIETTGGLNVGLGNSETAISLTDNQGN